MKKICFVMPKAYAVFNPSSGAKIGGAEVQTALWAKQLAKDKNYQVNFVVGDYGQKDLEAIDEVNLYKFTKLSGGTAFLKKIFLAFKIFFLLKKINSDFYLTTTANGISGVVNFFCKIFDKKHLHRTANEYDVNGDFIKNKFIEGMFYKLGLEHADLVITQNISHQKLLKEKHSKNSVVIKNSFEMDDERPDFNKQKYVFHVTRFFNWKNPWMFLDLVEKFPKEKFVLVCQVGESKDDPDWHKFKEKVKKFPNLEFKEKVPFDKIQDLYNQSKIFVNTSDFEGFPNTFIQAGIAGSALLSYKVDPDNFTTDFNCGLVCGGDKRLLARNLAFLLEKDDVRIKMGQNLFDYIKQNHDVTVNMEKLKKEIESL